MWAINLSINFIRPGNNRISVNAGKIGINKSEMVTPAADSVTVRTLCDVYSPLLNSAALLNYIPVTIHCQISTNLTVFKCVIRLRCSLNERTFTRLNINSILVFFFICVFQIIYIHHISKSIMSHKQSVKMQLPFIILLNIYAWKLHCHRIFIFTF